MPNLIDFFHSIDLLANVPQEDVEYLSQISSIVKFTKDDVIFQIGEIIQKVYIIKKGIVQVSIISTDNDLEILPDEVAGDLIGEMELWDDHPVIALCTAKTDVELIEINKKDFRKFLNRVPDVRDKLWSGTIEKWRNLENLFYKNIKALAGATQKINNDERLLFEQQKKIEEESRLKEIFIENISHELRTPLTIIQGITESFEILDSNKVSLDNTLYEKLKDSNSLLLDLINELLDFSQLSKGDIKLDYQWCDLNIELNAVLKSFAVSKLTRNKLEFSYNLPESVLINIDIRRIKQIIYHLVTNALKFTENGLVSINIIYDLKRSSKNLGSLTIVVKDNGIGISEEDLKIIFNKFVKIKNKYYSIRGTGLGLSLVKTIVDLMHGTITVKSKLNEGSTFTVEIPAPYKQVKMKKSKLEKQSIINQNDLKKVLLVDDYEDTHIIVKNFLKNKNVQVDSLFNYKKVIESLKQNDYDIILLDIMLPEVDGYKILAMIKNYYNKTKTMSKVPKIIAFTALGSEEELDKIEKSGFNSKLLKPFTKNDLLISLELAI